MKTFITISILCALALASATERVFAQTRPAPVLGADLGFAEWPHPLINGWQDERLGDDMARAFKSAGIRSLRMTFGGIYSPLGQAEAEAVKTRNKLTNKYPWFPFDDYADFIARHDFTTVVGINVEEGPEVASKVVEAFAKRRMLSKLVALELSNEPHLSPRPWLPEDFARQAAEVIRALTPTGVRFALPLTVGNENKTPTKLSDNEWNRRMLQALSTQIELKNRSDIYGVLHLYSRGVRAKTIDAFNKEVKPFAPKMRYLVTEFNIRLFLTGNPHLTSEYAREFAIRLAEVMSRPEIEAMYVHAVPYHSILYWANGGSVATVSGHKDERLKREDRARGWHRTPPGKVYDLYSRLAWNGEVIAYAGGDKQSYWAVKAADGRTIITFINIGNKTARKDATIAGQKFKLNAPAHSIAVFDGNIQVIEQLSLN